MRGTTTGLMERYVGRWTVAVVVVAACVLGTVAQEPGSTVSGPTHLFYVPAARVNSPLVLTVGLHELSLALPGAFQLQFSLLDNIGRLNAAGVYSPVDLLSVGVGLAHSFVHVGRGTHGIPRWAAPRAGVFVAWAPLHAERFRLVLCPHSQLGDRVSAGGDIGIQGKVTPWWSVIAESGYSFDFADRLSYVNADAGVRVHPPPLPHLFFDAGIDIEECAVQRGARPTVAAFFDVLFSISLRSRQSHSTEPQS